jgi:hypothetical protein
MRDWKVSAAAGYQSEPPQCHLHFIILTLPLSESIFHAAVLNISDYSKNPTQYRTRRLTEMKRLCHFCWVWWGRAWQLNGGVHGCGPSQSEVHSRCKPGALRGPGWWISWGGPGPRRLRHTKPEEQATSVTRFFLMIFICIPRGPSFISNQEDSDRFVTVLFTLPVITKDRKKITSVNDPIVK